MQKLKNKVILIIGASKGMGFAIAKLFETQGPQLALTGLRNMDNLKCFKNALNLKVDLASVNEITAVVDAVLKKFGRIDVLVISAAVFQQIDFEQISGPDLEDYFKIDFAGPFLLAQKIFAQMKLQKNGKIIFISSGAGKMGSGRAAHYAAMKAAINNLTKSLAKLGGRFNINVNSVAPGFIETDLIKEILAQKRERIEAIIPLGKVGKPEDVANLVLFLASDESNYITGQTICIDGGHCMT